MVFSNLEFLLFFLPAALAGYYLLPFRFRNFWLLLVSLVFYGWGEPVYIFLMIATIIVDYACGYWIDRKRVSHPTAARNILILAATVNLAILGLFKYYGLFAELLRRIPVFRGIPEWNAALPIGISFYTFQSLSYVIDVYRGDAEVQKNPFSFGAYVALYPQLIAGPIVRYRDVASQLRQREHSAGLFASGVRLFVVGLAKKVLLADVAGKLWRDSFLSVPTDSRTVLGSWLGLLCYSFQIYFDFSGYSDMAVGLGKMIGFRFAENFNYPYISKSVTEFWRRWHISLGTWFREYVYIPLGGNRAGRVRLYRNLLAVWLLTGLWHGAGWNFVLWGLYYFLLIAAEKAILLKKLERAPSLLAHLYTCFCVMVGWLIFVSCDITAGTGISYFGNLFGFGTVSFSDSAMTFDLMRCLPFLLLCAAACTPLPAKLYRRFSAACGNGAKLLTAAGTLLYLLLCLSYIVSSDFSPFLYYRF